MHIKSSLFVVSLVWLVVSLGNSARGDVRLPGFYGDHMVLQRNVAIRLWGWAQPDESIKVTLGEQTAEATANADGKWRVELPAMKGGSKAYTLTVNGSNQIQLNDVLIGEVWLCSGQSNMEWPVSRCTGAAAEIASANHPSIRHIKVPRTPSTVPQEDIRADWQVCSPKTVGSFTAAGYFMARQLQQQLDVPIGLINSSWGGTRVEPWTAPVGFQKVDALKDTFQSLVNRTPGTPQFRERLSAYLDSTKSWVADAKGSLDAGEGVESLPAYPDELKPFKSHQDPSMLYHGMIHALVGHPIRGVIWYQGEANRFDGMRYVDKKKALIGGWRELWGQGDFPFYFVQIAPYQYGNDDPTILPKFWEAQAAVQQIPRTGMVITNDIATLNDIHPPNKQDVGTRLAFLALKNDYGRDDIVAESPSFASLELLGDRLKVRFQNTAGGLETRDGKAPSGFQIVGVNSRGYRDAKAVIEGDSVILSSDQVEQPSAFRFAWHKLAQPNLTGGSGLPVGAFRGGKEPDFLSMLSLDDDYQLVYELDLASLRSNIQYDIDHSDKITSFDRVGYLLELDSSSHGPQKVFVSLDAFTDDVKKIGIPTIDSGATFQQQVTGLKVFTSLGGRTTESSLETGNIEFWPNNYGPWNTANTPGASNAVYDFGDQPVSPKDGYGSMQIHDTRARRTLFAINHWRSGPSADLGIGNNPQGNADWTFKGNAGSFSSKRLRVYVRAK